MTVQYYVASTLDGSVVMGARTYEFLLSEGLAEWPYSVPTVVLTHRGLPLAVAGADVRFRSGEIASIASELEVLAGGRATWVVGGGAVAAQFAEAGLLDTVILTVMPVILGSGTRLLPVTDLLALDLVSSAALPQGALELSYGVSRGPEGTTSSA